MIEKTFTTHLEIPDNEMESEVEVTMTAEVYSDYEGGAYFEDLEIHEVYDLSYDRSLDFDKLSEENRKKILKNCEEEMVDILLNYDYDQREYFGERQWESNNNR